MLQNPVLISVDLPVRWADLDADGRVNNVQMLRYVEEARMRWAAALDLAAEAPGLVPVVAALQCDYHAALHYPATVRAALRCTRLGRSSLQLLCTLHSVEAAAHVATATCAWVWTDAATGHSHPMPARLRATCTQPTDTPAP